MVVPPVNSSFPMLRELIHINERFFADRLSLVLLFRAPAVFSWVFNTIKPWIEPQTREKMHLLGSNYEEALLEHIDASMLEECYGGTRVEPYPILPPEDDE